MKFKDVKEVQDILDKTTSMEARLETSLLLLNSKFSELKRLLKPLSKYKDSMKNEIDQ